MKLSDEVLKKVQADHPDVELHVETFRESGEVIFEGVFKRPSRAVWKRFRVENLNEQNRAAAEHNLVVGCMLHPKAEAFEASCEARPVLLAKVRDRISELAGADIEVSSRKL